MSQANTTDNWHMKWIQESAGQTPLRKSVFDALDETKVEHLRAVLPSSTGLALEVGCGTARLLYMLSQLGWKTMGLDFVPSALHLAKQRFRCGSMASLLIHGDGCRLPLADRSVDLVASTGLLEHFPEPLPIVAEMFRVLRPGGVFYSDIVPRKFSLLRALDSLRRHSQAGDDGIYERSFSATEIKDLISRSAQVGTIQVFPAGICLPRKLFSRHVPVLYRNEYAVCKRFGRLSKALDGTPVAEWLGFYYFVMAVKQ